MNRPDHHSVKPMPMRDALLRRIWQHMAQDRNVWFVTADFGSPVLDHIRADFPDQFVNVGIAEQNLINVSAGLALEGMTVFAYAIAPFLTMRCYEQIRISLSLLSSVRSLNVNLIGVGAGYSYVVSGPTHQCYEDIALMRLLPNMQVYSPADHVMAARLFDRCLGSMGPKYLRLDAQVLPVLYEEKSSEGLSAGYRIHRRGEVISLVATGYMVHTALKVADLLEEEGKRIGVIDVYDLNGLNESGFCENLQRYQRIVSLEEGFTGRGGLDALIHGMLSRYLPDLQLTALGVPNKWRFDLGDRGSLHEQAGIGLHSVCRTIQSILSST